MIRIFRQPPPAEVVPLCEAEFHRVKEFFEDRAGAQRRFVFKLGRIRELRRALEEMFHGKCAYCESEIASVNFGDVDLFRPPRGAVGLDGGVSEEYYWWLSASWANLYWACATCTHNKANRFPVEGRRSQLGEDVSQEKAILLDPCVDEPSEYLVFGEEGIVGSTTSRGLVTIEILGLNRPSLIVRRRAEVTDLRLLFTRWASSQNLGHARTAKLIQETLLRETQDERPYACLRRQFAAQWLRDFRALLSGESEGIQAKVGRGANYLDPVERRRQIKQFRTARRSAITFSVEDATSKEAYQLYGAKRWIERIRIRNFKAIEDLTLTFPAEDSQKGEPWLMLLGENGSGKTSVLQAVAIALAGQRMTGTLGLDAATFLRHGQNEGSVEVWLTGEPEPELVRLTFRADRAGFVQDPPEPKTLLVGYGASRLLADAGHKATPTSAQIRIDSLFNPYLPLGDAEEWLLSLDRPAFDRVARSLKTLILAADDVKLEPNHGERRIDVLAGKTRLGDLASLSDGYRSVIALATDMMRFLSSLWENVEDAVGIALVDELEVHLHPRWKMRIVARLRQVFPRMRFLVTTHDPLCLRGLRDSEVAVMELSEEGKIAVRTDLPSVSGLRIEQILTSEHFGLESTTDPALDEMLQEYYRLLADPERATTNRARLETLRKELDARQLLGSSRRERMVLETIDSYLAEERASHGVEARAALNEATRARLRDIWAGRMGAQ